MSTNKPRTRCAFCPEPATVMIARRTGTVETCYAHENDGWSAVPATVYPVPGEVTAQ